MDDGSDGEKTKGSKKCVIKRILKLEDYKKCLQNKKIILKSKQRFKREAHNALTEEINKIALRSNNDQRLETFKKIRSYRYGTSV